MILKDDKEIQEAKDHGWAVFRCRICGNMIRADGILTHVLEHEANGDTVKPDVAPKRIVNFSEMTDTQLILHTLGILLDEEARIANDQLRQKVNELSTNTSKFLEAAKKWKEDSRKWNEFMNSNNYTQYNEWQTKVQQLGMILELFEKWEEKVDNTGKTQMTMVTPTVNDLFEWLKAFNKKIIPQWEVVLPSKEIIRLKREENKYSKENPICKSPDMTNPICIACNKEEKIFDCEKERWEAYDPTKIIEKLHHLRKEKA